MSKWIVIAGIAGSLCTGLATACGGDGGSGVSRSKSLVSLSDAELTELCEYRVDVAGPDRVIDCGGGDMLTLRARTVPECVTDLQNKQGEFPGCTATVGEVERCAEDLPALTDAQLCADQWPASCGTLLGTCGGP